MFPRSPQPKPCAHPCRRGRRPGPGLRLPGAPRTATRAAGRRSARQRSLGQAPPQRRRRTAQDALLWCAAVCCWARVDVRAHMLCAALLCVCVCVECVTTPPCVCVRVYARARARGCGCGTLNKAYLHVRCIPVAFLHICCIPVVYLRINCPLCNVGLVHPLLTVMHLAYTAHHDVSSHQPHTTIYSCLAQRHTCAHVLVLHTSCLLAQFPSALAASTIKFVQMSYGHNYTS